MQEDGGYLGVWGRSGTVRIPARDSENMGSFWQLCSTNAPRNTPDNASDNVEKWALVKPKWQRRERCSSSRETNMRSMDPHETSGRGPEPETRRSGAMMKRTEKSKAISRQKSKANSRQSKPKDCEPRQGEVRGEAHYRGRRQPASPRCPARELGAET